MSEAYYGIESLRFYDEDEIEMREMMTRRFAGVVRRTLQEVNPAWNDDWKEVASCSVRTDFSKETRVCEIALGLDRLVEIYGKNNHDLLLFS